MAPILFCSAIGFVWAKTGQDYPVEFISKLVMNVGAPSLVAISLMRTQVELSELLSVAQAAVIVLLAVLLLSALLLRVLRLPIRHYLNAMAFPNCGNMGLPVCLFAFGEQGLALGLGYFLVMLIAHMSFGLTLVGDVGENTWATVKKQMSQPIYYVVTFGVLAIFYRWQPPMWLDNSLGLISGFTIPLMMITLGVSLAKLSVKTLFVPSLMVFARLALSLLLALLACYWLDLTGTARAVVLVQAAMPVAVFNYLMAARFKQGPEAVAAMVLLSTLAAFIYLPLLLAQLMG